MPTRVPLQVASPRSVMNLPHKKMSEEEEKAYLRDQLLSPVEDLTASTSSSHSNGKWNPTPTPKPYKPGVCAPSPVKGRRLRRDRCGELVDTAFKLMDLAVEQQSHIRDLERAFDNMYKE